MSVTSLTETTRRSDVILLLTGEEVNFNLETVTLASGTAASKVGQVLGKISIGAATSAAKSGGNAANTGALTLDATTPVLPNAQVGVYTARCTAAASNSGTFRVTDPKGNVLGDVAVAATFANQIKFAIADGTQDFVVGEGFDITVAAGSGSYTQVTPAAADGSAVATAVLLADTDASLADKTGLALVRGPAVLKESGLLWTSGMTAGQKTTAKAQLAAAGMPVRVAL